MVPVRVVANIYISSLSVVVLLFSLLFALLFHLFSSVHLLSDLRSCSLLLFLYVFSHSISLMHTRMLMCVHSSFSSDLESDLDLLLCVSTSVPASQFLLFPLSVCSCLLIKVGLLERACLLGLLASSVVCNQY